eukprot:TRINITY_DN19108_c0_g1_i1.p1 TRINITY_DN19108_c0_g1~~TRINITY_DN19108_c0_g1_i1.p1  ORF type:complete len:556 (-),score=146.36 TRINITY_DN19108_c0_g1_i1:173-1708(-)
MAESRRIAELEELLKQKDAELESYQKSLQGMPDWSKIEGQICLRNQESTCILMQSYKPKTVGDKRRQLEDYVRDLVINNDHISKMEKRLREAITRGLGKKTHADASVKCFPTYVRELPSGFEHGQFLALDLGGTNFRVVLMEIGEQGKFEMDSEVYAISKELMEGSGESLFDHIADCLAKFVQTRKIQDKKLPLGFTFSFPCRQKGLAVGELITWTKGFKCSGVEENDVVALLMEAIKKRDDVQVDVAAILNDTTGCLMSCAWKNPKCRIGLIIGTGTNACYLEELEHVELWDGDHKEPKHMIVNTEWGAFGNQGELDFIQTKWDQRVDEGSINPGKQIFEKMISGMYMGEVVRQVLVDLVNEGLIFVGCKDTSNVFQRGRFFTKYVSEIESDQVGEFTRCREALKDLGINDPSEEDCSSIRYVCEKVSRRAGFMVAAGITALLKKMNYKDVVVAIDGSVFRFHPHFPNIMKSRISQLMGIDYKFDLMLSTDGSGRGAALVAATLLGQCAI